MRHFNTSGPNIPAQHYTLPRLDLIEKGKDLVYNSRYFTIWAPRQTGKSTYFRLLATALEQEGYLVCHINFENYLKRPLSTFMERLVLALKKSWGMDFEDLDMAQAFHKVSHFWRFSREKVTWNPTLRWAEAI